MATRRYKASPTTPYVIEEVGGANNSHIVEVTVDLAATLITDGSVAGGQRAIKKEEVLAQMERIQRYILTANWLPA